MECCHFRLSTLFCRHNENLIDIIQLLLETNIDVNSKVNEGWKRNALNFACYHYKNENLIDIVKLLIEKNIDVICKDNNGWNDLTLLFRRYHKEDFIEIIKLLL
jgi:ankyrin repeat protein